MKQKILTLLIIVGIIVAIQAPAQAHGGAWSSWCIGPDKICVAIHENGTGNYEYWNGPINICVPILSFMGNDVITSIDNHFNRRVTFWHNGNCTGTYQNVYPNRTINDLVWVNDDELSSFKIWPT